MMMSASIPRLILIAAVILSISFCHGINSDGKCIPSEREALVKLKSSLDDYSNKLESWNGESGCCSWYGVICDNFTGHVLELHLQGTDDGFGYSALSGSINHSLLELKHLNYLDLSNNMFFGTSIPEFFGFMSSLRYLNLSKSGFKGLIPHQLGNLSNLQYLIIDSSYVDKLDWVSRLSSLKFLEFSSVNLSKAIHWLDSLSKLPSLEQLHLSGCELTRIPPVYNVRFSSLSVLDLSGNDFHGLIPGWISSLTSLTYLYLSNNKFSGPISSFLQNLTSLKELDLSYNHFNSSIPDWFGGFTRLEHLNLRQNELEGKIPSSIGNLTSITSIDLSYNSFEGVVPMSFINLCNLRSLSLSFTRLSQEVNELIEILSGCGAEKLESLDLSDSMFSGYLTDLLKNFKSLVSLGLSRNRITGTLPVSFGEMASLTSLDLSFNKLNGSIPLSFGRLQNLENLDVSSNSLEGEVSEIHLQNLSSLIRFDASGNHLILRVNPNWIPPFQLVQELHLRSCEVGPMFPTWLRYLNHLNYLDLSNSKISSTLPTWFQYNFSSTLTEFNLSQNQMYGMIHNLSNNDKDYSFIDLSSNYFEGPLPHISSTPSGIYLSNNLFSGSIHNFLCNKMYQGDPPDFDTTIVILNKNLLHGEIPGDCWMYWTSLVIVELSNNNFSGNIPATIGSLTNLMMLNLRNNSLTGDIPSSLRDCKVLTVLDLGENELSGEIPRWIGKRSTELLILNFRGNKLHGHMSTELCNLTDLQILDFADNILNGTMPTCLGNLRGMLEDRGSRQGRFSFVWYYGPRLEYTGSSSIVRKGMIVTYSTILRFVKSLDLSNNNFVGEIPEGITSLSGLQSLNLSFNSLTGRIPENIGAMKTLEALDMSRNRLVGEIPRTMSALNFLNSLNLSNNNLSGRIPSSTQLQSLDASSFAKNNLCGPPLDKECSTSGAMPPSSTEESGQGDESGTIDWFYFYVSLAPGFVAGFWFVIGPLVFNKRWRSKYFNFLKLLWDKICKK